MTTTLYAIFDGQVFIPEEPIPLLPNTRVRLHLESVEIEPDSSERLNRPAPSTGLFVSTDLRLGEESELFKKPGERTDEEWIAETERRARAAIAGEPGIPWEEVRSAVKRRLDDE